MLRSSEGGIGIRIGPRPYSRCRTLVMFIPTLIPIVPTLTPIFPTLFLSLPFFPLCLPLFLFPPLRARVPTYWRSPTVEYPARARICVCRAYLFPILRAPIPAYPKET